MSSSAEPNKGGDDSMAAVRKYIPIPSELRLTHHWNQALERFSFNTAVGSASCGLLSLVLFRSPMLRFGFMTFGAGFGAGEAFRFSSTEFEKETKSGGK